MAAAFCLAAGLLLLTSTLEVVTYSQQLHSHGSSPRRVAERSGQAHRCPLMHMALIAVGGRVDGHFELTLFDSLRPQLGTSALILGWRTLRYHIRLHGNLERLVGCYKRIVIWLRKPKTVSWAAAGLILSLKMCGR